MKVERNSRNVRILANLLFLNEKLLDRALEEPPSLELLEALSDLGTVCLQLARSIES
jgi:hypothetical protein